MENTPRREKRRFRRLSYRASVRFSAGGIAGSGFATDVSARGLFIQCNFIPPDGELIELIIQDAVRGDLPCAGRVIRLRRTHRSVAVVNPSGFGVQLTNAPSYYALIRALTEQEVRSRARSRA